MKFSFISLGLVTLGGAVSPGPDFTVVAKNALLHSRRSGIYTALGIALATLIHVSYCLLGLGLIVSQSSLLFNVLKYIGALYLFWLSMQTFSLKKPMPLAVNPQQETGLAPKQAFKQGFLTCLLNPYVILFFMALFSLVLSQQVSTASRLGYGLEVPLITFLWFSALSLLITRPWILRWVEKNTQTVYRCFGCLLLFCSIQLIGFW